MKYTFTILSSLICENETNENYDINNEIFFRNFIIDLINDL